VIRATASGDALVFETEILKDLEFALRIVSGDGAEGSATRTGAFSRAGETGALRMGLAISLRRSEAIKRSVEYRVRARDCLNVRTQPSLHAPVIGCVKKGRLAGQRRADDRGGDRMGARLRAGGEDVGLGPTRYLETFDI
jgi:hypothetical protein